MPQTPPPAAPAKLIGSDRNLRVVRRGSWRWRVVKSAGPSLLDHLGNPDAVFQDPGQGVTILKRDLTTDVAVVGDPPAWVVKRYKSPKLLKPLRDLVRGSAARRAFHWALALEQAGVATAPVLAYGQRGPARLAVVACLLTRYIDQSCPLVTLLEQGVSDPVLSHVAQLIAKLHAAGISNRDLKAHNILVRRTQTDDGQENVQAFLIDLDGLARRRLTDRLREKNLARLRRSFMESCTCGDRDWETFYRFYQQHARL